MHVILFNDVALLLGKMAEVLRVLGRKLASGVLTRTEHDAILAAHIASTRPPTIEDAGAGPAVSPASPVVCCSCQEM